MEYPQVIWIEADCYLGEADIVLDKINKARHCGDDGPTRNDILNWIMAENADELQTITLKGDVGYQVIDLDPEHQRTFVLISDRLKEIKKKSLEHWENELLKRRTSS